MYNSLYRVKTIKAMPKRFIASFFAIKVDLDILSSEGRVSGEWSHLMKKVLGDDKESLEDIQVRMEGWYGSQKCPVSDGWRNHDVIVTEVD
jgi:hypothetical protein